MATHGATPTKRCTVCKDYCSLDQFYNSKASKDGLGYRCKSCDNKARRKHYNANIEAAKASARARNIKCKYGISMDTYNQMFDDQLGRCKICGCDETSKRVHGSLAVDHCHDTGIVRGLLCNQCNRALGMFNDNAYIIDKAHQYLRGLL